MQSLISLFLSQSYKDTWDDYKRSLSNPNFICWDYIILTASNDQQAAAFQAQLDERQAAGFLPARTKFAIIPDKGGVRIGSGVPRSVSIARGGTSSSAYATAGAKYVGASGQKPKKEKDAAIAAAKGLNFIILLPPAYYLTTSRAGLRITGAPSSPTRQRT